jgi:hypothetical protein
VALSIAARLNVGIMTLITGDLVCMLLERRSYLHRRI